VSLAIPFPCFPSPDVVLVVVVEFEAGGLL